MNSIVIGQMKEGKTTLALFLARQHSPGVVVWDPRGMVDGIQCHDAEELYAAIREGLWQQGPLTYVPQSGDIDSEFTAFCTVVFPPNFRFRKFACVIDEAAQLQKSNSIHPDLSRIVRQHPRDVAVIQTTHSLQDYHRASKDLMNHLFCFKSKGRSLEAVIEYTDGSDEMREAIRNLPPHHLVYYSFERHCGPEFEVWSEPSRWYQPLAPSAEALQGSGLGEGPEGDGQGGSGHESARPSSSNSYQGWVN